MSDVIHLLPENVANRIAAGEVVSSPAAAVKELVENAVDAGASTITIEILDAGQTLIHVLDNGCGMSPSDARMAFERHATSKIQEADDLYRLRTMGFRGEALGAIASESKVELRTRRADYELGTCLNISEGEVISTESCVFPQGTSIKVRDLFFNNSRKRGFLPKASQEQANIKRTISRIALVNPTIAFVLRAEDKLVFDLPATSLKQRILDLTNRSFDKKLLRVDYTSDMVEISGFITHPQTATSARSSQRFFFVNERYMVHPSFQRAVEDAYRGLIPETSYPSYFLYLKVPVENVEINLTPSKTDVRFVDEALIRDLLQHLVREKLSSSASIPMIDFDNPPTIDIPSVAGSQPVASSSSGAVSRRVFMGGVDSAMNRMGCSASASTHTSLSSYDISWDKLSESFAQRREAIEDATSLFEQDEQLCEDRGVGSSARPLAHGVFSGSEHQTVGQLIYKGRYIVTSLKHSLTLIDCQRAQERIYYEQAMQKLLEGELEVQELMHEELLELSLEEVDALDAILDEIAREGFVLEPQGDGRYVLKQAPVVLLDKARSLILAFVGHCLETREASVEYLRRATAIAIAEAEVKPYGTRLEQGDIDNIMAQLFVTSDPYLTPQGRIIMTSLSDVEIERRFQ